jgi:DNA-binding CsgD family transcriptional regulator
MNAVAVPLPSVQRSTLNKGLDFQDLVKVSKLTAQTITSTDDKPGGSAYKSNMQEFWDISSTSATSRLPVSVFSNLLKVSVQTTSQPILDAINQISDVDYVSLVEYPSLGQNPVQVAHAAKERQDHRDVTKECFERYRSSYFNRDPVIRLLKKMEANDQRCDGVSALHMSREDIPDNAWRRDIYERENLTDRLSFLFSPKTESLLAVNLYRNAKRGPFTSGELEVLLPIAPLIAQVYKSSFASQNLFNITKSVCQLEEILQVRAHTLSSRERAVCARVATGMSVDGIAVDLDVSPSTVMTLRKRAYAKLRAQGGPSDRMRLIRWIIAN